MNAEQKFDIWVRLVARDASGKSRTRELSFPIRVDERRGVVFVPEQAIVPNSDEPFVYRVVDDTATRVPVETGARIARHVEIKSGLAPGDVIVTAGQQRLADGTPVTITPPTYVPPSPADEEIQVTEGS